MWPRLVFSTEPFICSIWIKLCANFTNLIQTSLTNCLLLEDKHISFASMVYIKKSRALRFQELTNYPLNRRHYYQEDEMHIMTRSPSRLRPRPWPRTGRTPHDRERSTPCRPWSRRDHNWWWSSYTRRDTCGSGSHPPALTYSTNQTHLLPLNL